MTGGQPQGVRTSWHVAPYLLGGTLRDPEPAWVDPSDPAPTAAAFRLQARVARAVVRALGQDAGKLLSERLGGGRGHGVRSIQGKLSGEYTLHPADLARWLEVLPLSRDELGTPADLAALPTEWQLAVATAAPVAGGPRWAAVTVRLAGILDEERTAGRLRLAGHEVVSYLVLQALVDGGGNAHQVRRAGDGFEIRTAGRMIRLLVGWGPDGADGDWEGDMRALHRRLGTLAGESSADRVAVLCLGRTAVALLDVWDPPPDTAPCPSGLVVPAAALAHVDAGPGPLALELVAREPWSDGWVLAVRVLPG